MPGSSQRLSRWQKRALAVAEQVPVSLLHREVRAAAAAATAGRARRWLVAISGGSDSVALALLVWAYWPTQRERLVLAHFNHGVRGAASAADARFCRALAKGLGVRFETAKAAGSLSGAGEAEMRTARNMFLDRIRRQHRAKVIFTGHQLDDVAETMLMRLARGSGTGGLAAPRPVQAFPNGAARWRPLLALSRDRLREALTDAGVTWREDGSNEEPAFFRNRVRSKVMPNWVDAAGRDAVAGAALSRELLDEDDRAVTAWLEEIAPFNAAGELLLDRLAGRPRALWRRALHRWLGQHWPAGRLTRAGFTDLLARVEQGRAGRFSLGKHGFARIRRGKLVFEKLIG